MGNSSICHASVQSIKSLFSYLLQSNAKFVFWIRSADYERQLYVSSNYEAIWKRSCRGLYEDPQSFNDAICEDDLKREYSEFNSRKHNSGTNITLFRIKTPSGKIHFIKDYSFALYDEMGKVAAIAGFGECIDAKDWEVLVENKHEKEMESCMIDMLLNFASKKYSLKMNCHSYSNILGMSQGQSVFINDIIVALSKREADCLNYMMSEMSSKEIARILKLSPRTVETYLNNIKIKTKTKNNIGLMSKLGALIDINKPIGFSTEKLLAEEDILKNLISFDCSKDFL